MAVAIAIGALWLADMALNEGRYADAVEGGLFALIGR